MSEKLTQEELLDELATWYGFSKFHTHPCLKGHHEQAYDQIKEIVGGHFKYDYLRNDPECRSVDEILEEKVRQQKPTVTREWIAERVMEHVRPGTGSKKNYKENVYLWCSVVEEILIKAGIKIGG